MEFIILAVGIAAAGYFIGDGLKNFKNPGAMTLVDQLVEDKNHELIKESSVHHYICVSKEDAKQLIKEHADIPHILQIFLNEKAYFFRGGMIVRLKQVYL